jgi:capsule biosynthesis phosphatase
MNIIIPLGGKGERFKTLGYTKPKPLIKVLGREIICWLIDNLNHTYISDIIIPYNSDLIPFRFEDFIKYKYPKLSFKFIPLKEQTEGAAETILIAANLIINNNNIMCIDGDNFFNIDIIDLYLKNTNKNCIFGFYDSNTEPIYSYLKLNKLNHIVEIKEKNKISDIACCGVYCFENKTVLENVCKFILDNKIKQNNEYYISNVFAEMIKREIIVDSIIIPQSNFICLGTPLQVKIFCNNIPKISAYEKINNNLLIKKSKICFDLDNTLVTFPVIAGDYSTVLPIHENINFLKYLHKMGHYIIIHTARRMKTHKGNVGKIMADIGKITFETLDNFEIPYDEIYFGKPDADFYIDDKAISCFNSLEKELGFYESKIDPRSFNEIKGSSIETYIKKSNNLQGEIYYYLNIPNSIKDMFPIMIRYDESYKWFEMEKINGIPLTKIYLSGDLNPTLLNHVLNSIDRIHNSLECNLNIDIYKNYCRKLSRRFKEFDYSVFPEYAFVYDLILKYLDTYEFNEKGTISVIHGDPVFTNIMINQFGKIKFIDMRGKIDDELTIFGDKNYDWAKVYQSLIGYDEILEGKFLSLDYKNNLIKIFENFIVTKFGENTLFNIKFITASLLYSLIPLHNNDKCLKYYSLCTNLLNNLRK